MAKIIPKNDEPSFCRHSLKELIKGLSVEVKGSPAVNLVNLTSDSRCVLPGSLFLAKKGAFSDGMLFIDQAVASGASAILTNLYNPFLKTTQLIHPCPGELEALLAARFYHHPSRELFVFGVTGTNGKTTTATLVKHLLDGIGQECGLMTTVETVIRERRSKSILTTHDAIFNQKMLREMKERNCSAAALEISSHGLTQGRVEEIDFDFALFTNLTADHLDYHRDMQEYATAKSRLFALLEKSSKKDKCAIANGDDPYTPEILGSYRGKRILFGLREGCDVRAEAINLNASGTDFRVEAMGKTVPFFTSLIGKFNVYNLLGAIAVGVCLGIPLEKMSDLFATIRGVPGRLERVPNKKNLNIFVDYAHTEDALENVLKTLREIGKGRIITVFGAGGGRDKGRRIGLARAAERGSDLSIVTSDNPRNENPEEICRQILAGFQSRAPVRIELDRKKAIKLAIDSANPEDIVLIAGKGHECVQIFAHETIPFDDCAVAFELLQRN